MQMLRESIVNALVHRDYEIPGAKSQLLLTPHSMERSQSLWDFPYLGIILMHHIWFFPLCQ